MTDDLIDRLTRDLRPVGPGVVARRLILALAIGGAVALAGMALVLGFRPDLATATASRMFWMKLAYTLGFAGLGLWCVARLGRPGLSAAGRLPWLLAPLVGVAPMVAMQLIRTPSAAWRPQVMGDTAIVCPWRILAVAQPVFAALIWALRTLAPTRPRLAGAMAGLTAGGLGAAIYALHCPETGAPFLAIWYTLGILAPCALGALAGPRLLRW